MNRKYQLLVCIMLFVLCFPESYQAKAQAFKKGSLLVSISEGGTTAHCTTKDINSPKRSVMGKGEIGGCRDPLIVEYGVTNKWGVGFSSGADIFRVNPSRFYNFNIPDYKSAEVKTSEFTFDLNYHYLVNKKLDLSAFTSVGTFSLAFKGEVSDFKYNYESKGGIIRIGSRVRYYVYKRFGLLGMVSAFSGTGSPKKFENNTVANNYATNLTGYAVEAGICFRFF